MCNRLRRGELLSSDFLLKGIFDLSAEIALFCFGISLLWKMCKYLYGSNMPSLINLLGLLLG